MLLQDAQNISRYTLFHTCTFFALQVNAPQLKRKKCSFFESKLLSLVHLYNLRLYTVCFGIIIVSLNTTCSHFFMFTLRFHKIFSHGSLV